MASIANMAAVSTARVGAVPACHIARRMASAAAAQSAPSSAAVNQSKVMGVTVASVDSSSPVSSVSVVVRAGSRYETAANAGVSHYLRNLAFQSTNSRTAFRITREIESLGGRLTATSSREYISYTATFLRDDAATVVDTLLDSVTGQVFHPWELKAQNVRVQIDLDAAACHPQIALLEDLHTGAFRNTLGSSVNCPQSQVGGISVDAVRAFTASRFTSGNMFVVGSGISHQALEAIVARSSAGITPGAGSSTSAAKYFGGAETRNHTGNQDGAYVALGYQGVAAGGKNQAASLVLRNIAGAASHVSYSGSSAAASKVGAAVAAAVGRADVTAFSASYADTGLFGLYTASAAADSRAAVTAASSALKSVLSGDFTDADLARAKNQLRTEILDADRASVLEALSIQAATGSALATPEQMADAVSALTAADVKMVGAAILASKPVYSARGTIDNTPYLDELKL